MLLDKIVKEEKRISQRWMLFDILMKVLGLSRNTFVDLRRVHLHNGCIFIVYLNCIVSHCSLNRNNNHLSYINA